MMTRIIGVRGDVKGQRSRSVWCTNAHRKVAETPKLEGRLSVPYPSLPVSRSKDQMSRTCTRPLWMAVQATTCSGRWHIVAAVIQSAQLVMMLSICRTAILLLTFSVGILSVGWQTMGPTTCVSYDNDMQIIYMLHAFDFYRTTLCVSAVPAVRR